MISLENQLEDAMLAESPTLEFRRSIFDRLGQGADRQALQQELERLRMVVDSEREDVILEVLDFLTGWSSPHMKI